MNFIEQQQYIHSDEYKRKQMENKIVDRGNSYISNCIMAITRGVEKKYSEHHISGYVGRNTGYDCEEHDLISPEHRSREDITTNYDLAAMELDPQLLAYVLRHLPIEIEKLGIKNTGYGMNKSS